jgi:hypothetical protein
MTAEEAFETVADPGSSASNFEGAFKQLEGVKGEASFWLKIAADNRYEPNRRRKCIKHFFNYFSATGMHLSDVTGLMDKDVNWISFDKIRKEDRGMIVAGWIPEALTKGESGFTVPILSGASGDYHLVIFFSFQEDVELSDLREALKDGKSNTTNAAKITIAACAGWDSNDDKRRFPDSKQSPWQW